MVRGVRDKLTGQASQLRGKVSEVADPDGEDDASRRKDLAGGGTQLVAVRVPVQADHLGVLHVRHEPLLKCEAVGVEDLERYGDAVVPVRQTVLPAVRLERVGTRRVGQAGGAALRLEEHAGRHVDPPALHWVAEDAERVAVPAEVRG
jgi:hypothetical protein